MAFTLPNWSCVSNSLSQGQSTIIPFMGSSTILNSPDLFTYGSPNDTAAEIMADNYFLSQYKSLSIGDMVIGFGTDTNFILQVTAVSSTLVSTESFAGGGGGSGTVTSVTAGTGLIASPNPITTAGTISINTNYIYNVYNVLDFGASPSNPDNTAAFQAAFNAAMTVNGSSEGGGTVYAPSGLYEFDGTVIVTGPVTFIGDGSPGTIGGTNFGGTLLIQNNNVATISVQNTNPFRFEHFGILYAGSLTLNSSAEAIQISGSALPGPATTFNFESYMNDVSIQDSFCCIALYSVDHLSFENCRFETRQFGANTADMYCVNWQSTFNSDGTDTSFQSCTMSGAGVAFNHLSGSGMRIINNKLICSKGCFQSTASGALSDLIIANNSIESGQSQFAITIKPINTFFNIQIIDNEIEVGDTGVALQGIQIGTPSVASSAYDVIVSDNILLVNGDPGNCIAFYNTDNFTCIGNVMGAFGGSFTPIFVDSTCSNGQVNANSSDASFFGVGINNSTTTSYVGKGTATMSTGTANISNTLINAGSLITPSSQSNTVTGALRVSSQSAGVAVITSLVGTDAGTIGYTIQ